MNRWPFIVAGLGLGAGVALMLPPFEKTADDGTPEVMQDTDRTAPFLAFWDRIAGDAGPEGADNVRAFLAAIRWAEGTAGPDGYRTLFGGRLFSSYADHPRVAQRFTDKAGRTLWTTAAGAYQFLAVSPIPGGGTTRVNTWDRLRERLGLPDFSPASQDAAAVELIREAGALGAVQAGDFATAVHRVRRVWASLPGAGYAQAERRFDQLQAAYLAAGGNLA